MGFSRFIGLYFDQMESAFSYSDSMSAHDSDRKRNGEILEKLQTWWLQESTNTSEEKALNIHVKNDLITTLHAVLFELSEHTCGVNYGQRSYYVSTLTSPIMPGGEGVITFYIPKKYFPNKKTVCGTILEAW